MGTKNQEPDGGFKRLYQAWISWPRFDHSYGEWLHSTCFPVGNPRCSSRRARDDLDAWLERHRDKVEKVNKEVADSKRVGSDIRVNGHVYQIWPMTEKSPWNPGMFGQNTPDPFA